MFGFRKYFDGGLLRRWSRMEQRLEEERLASEQARATTVEVAQRRGWMMSGRSEGRQGFEAGVSEDVNVAGAGFQKSQDAVTEDGR
ncbi:hypothetical protein QQ045_019465 [Rhodiola kirilowii]